MLNLEKKHVKKYYLFYGLCLFSWIFRQIYDSELNSVKKFKSLGKFYLGYSILKIIVWILRFPDYRKGKTNLKTIQNTIIDVKFDEKSKSELRIGLACNDEPGNRKNVPNNEGKFRKIEKKRLPLFLNPPLSFWKVFHSKAYIIFYLSAKFEPI